MVGKEIAVKKYVVRLSTEERAQLDELIRKGKAQDILPELDRSCVRELIAHVFPEPVHSGLLPSEERVTKPFEFCSKDGKQFLKSRDLRHHGYDLRFRHS